jgi:hypothetical protein
LIHQEKNAIHDVVQRWVIGRMLRLILDEDRGIISKVFMAGANLAELGSMTWRLGTNASQALKYFL